MVNAVGKWALIIGAVLAIIMGIGAGLGQAWGTNVWVMLLIVVLGLIVGFANMGVKEVRGLLIAVIALLAVNTANLARIDTLIPSLGTILAAIIADLILLVAPVGLIVAIMELYNILAK